jgi:hypothetical protein
MRILYLNIDASKQVLVIAMSLSYGINDYIEGSVIAGVISLNIIIGYDTPGRSLDFDTADQALVSGKISRLNRT